MFNDGIIKLLEEGKKNRFMNPLTAIRQLNEVIKFLPKIDRIDPYFDLADAYAEIEDYENAKTIYEKILEIDPTNPGAYYGIAYSNELLKGDIKESLYGYEKAIELDRNYKEAYYYAATIYGDLGDYGKAVEYLKRVLEIDPKDYIAYNDLGSIYETLGNYDKALKYLNKGININSDYYLARFNRGVVYKALGNHKKALEEYRVAKENSDDIYIFLNMSAIFIEEKKFEKAIKILTEGIERNPHHILYYNRACSYSKLNKKDKALEDFINGMEIDEVVLEWGKNDPDLKEIIRRNYDYIKNRRTNRKNA